MEKEFVWQCLSGAEEREGNYVWRLYTDFYSKFLQNKESIGLWKLSGQLMNLGAFVARMGCIKESRPSRTQVRKGIGQAIF